MSSKCKIMVALAAAVLTAGRFASADTISVTDYLNPADDTVANPSGDVDVDPVQVGTTLNAMSVLVPVYEYQYKINIDSGANISNNDGFVIDDFNGFTTDPVAGSDFGDTAVITSIDGDPTLANDFQTMQIVGSPSVPATGVGSLNDGSVIDGDAVNAGFIDNPGIPNLVFLYTSPPAPGRYLGGGVNSDLLLSLFSTEGTPAFVFASGLDQSGAGGTFHPDDGPVFGPTSLPTPASWLGGTALFALLGVSRMLKARRIEA